MINTRLCTKCGQNKPINQFNFKNKLKNIRRNVCKECTKEYGKNHYIQNKSIYKKKARIWTTAQIQKNVEYVFNFLLQHPCIKCGEKNPVLLEFDHKDRLQKRANIADLSMSGCSLETLKKEIEKCDILCANHHRLKTAEEDNWRVWNLYNAFINK